MKSFFVRFLLLIIVPGVAAEASFAEDCTRLGAQAEEVEEKFTARCTSAIGQKKSADNQAAQAGQIENGDSANIEMGAKVLSKVAGFHGGTSYTAWDLCRTALTQSKSEIKTIVGKIDIAAKAAVQSKNGAAVQKCSDAMKKTEDVIEKLIASYQEKQTSLVQGMNGAEKAKVEARIVAETAAGGGAGGKSGALENIGDGGSGGNNFKSPDMGTTMMAANMAMGMAKSAGGSGKSGSSEAATGAGSSGGLAPAALPPTQGLPAQNPLGVQNPLGTQNPSVAQGPSVAQTPSTSGEINLAGVESCTTSATGLGTAECQIILARRNPTLIRSANSASAPVIATASVDTSALGTGQSGNGQSVVAKAYGASLLKSNSVTLAKMCKNNELVGCL